MWKYLSEPKSWRGRVKIELDLSNYATKADLKNTAGVDTPTLAKKVDLVILKSDADKSYFDKLRKVSTNLRYFKIKVGKLDVDKLAPVPVDWSKKLRIAAKKD